MSFPIAPAPIPKRQPSISATSSSPSTGQNIPDPITIDSDSETDTIIPDASSSPSSSRGGAKSLQKLAERRVLNDLRVAVRGYQATANYCLGGSIPITASREHIYSSSKKPITAPPIVVRFDTPNGKGKTGKVEFPVHSIQGTEDREGAVQGEGELEELLQACAPATFGCQGKDMLDESYRKAGKLDRSQFAVDFHPHDFGIVDAVAQTLLPSFGRMKLEGGNVSQEHWGVVAELYKLNIYSGPSGKFQAHVDTPRGTMQFGSLVVCFPHPHEGGQLRVSHKGHEALFDWSNLDEAAIKWAAFYSDCEHEVLEVKSGHRITLTYNLYISEHVGGILQRHPTVDPTLYPLYKGAKQMLEQPGFMQEGGTLGFFCAHQYAHTTKNTEELMPYALKGIDATLFMVFQALGVSVTVRPVLGDEAWEGWNERRQEIWFEEHDDDVDFDDFEDQDEAITRVGTKFHQLGNSDVRIEDDDDPSDDIQRYWAFEEFKDITWLNSSGVGWETAMVNLKYGNEASIMFQYSHAAILIDIPSRAEQLAAPTTVPTFLGTMG